MPENQKNQGAATKTTIKPALIVDRATVRDYGECLRHILVGLSGESCNSILICPPGSHAGNILSPLVDMIHHPELKMPIFWHQNRRVVLERIVKLKPTVLHCLSPAKARLTKYLAEQLDIPYVVTFNSSHKTFAKSVVTSHHCAAVMASSKRIAENLNQSYRNHNFSVQPVNLGTFVEDTCVCFCDRSRLASLVTVGSLDNSMDFMPLLGALRHLSIDGFEFMLAIIGTGSDEHHIHKQIKSLGLSQIVTLSGDIQPLRSVFAGADIFVQPQPKSQYNTHLLESMSMGMAVAASPGGVEDILVEDQTCVLFDPSDELSLYGCLKKLLSQREFARQIAMGAQSYLRKNCTVSKMVASLIEVYQNAQKSHTKSQK